MRFLNGAMQALSFKNFLIPTLKLMFNLEMRSCLCIILLKSVISFGATTTSGDVSAYITTALTLSTVSNIDFGTAPQGDPAKVIAPTSASSATFTVTGESNLPYSISLPSFINITNSSGKTIRVDGFTSSPVSTGLLDSAGTQTLKVGAQRAALAANQSVGIYSGSFTVTVIY